MAAIEQDGEAVVRIVTALREAELIAPDRTEEARRVVGSAIRPETAQGVTRHMRLAEVAGYVGAALVMAAVTLLLAQRWADLTPAARVAALLGVAVILVVAAVAMATLVGKRSDLRSGGGTRVHLVAVLSILAAIAAGGAMGVWADTYLHGTGVSNPAGRLAFLTALVVALAAYLLSPHGLVQATAAFASFGILTSTFSDTYPYWTRWMALAVLLVAVVWLLLAERRVWRERTIGRLIGSAFGLFAAQAVGFDSRWDPEWWAYGASFLLAAISLALYLWRDDWAYLVVGVLALTIAVTRTLLDITDGSLGAGGAVLVAGLTLLAGSGLALWLRRSREAHSR